MGFLRRRESVEQIKYASVDDLLDDYELPSFSGVVSEALAMLDDPDSDLPAVAQVINLDPGTAVSVLRLVNSAAAGLSRPVGSLHQAIALLGRNQIESLLISKAVGRALTDPGTEAFDNRRFWLASAQRASIASSLAEIIEPSRRSETFTAALLQDMAMPVMCERLSGYDQLHAEWVGGDIVAIDEVEEDRFGRSHEDLGAWMCTQWALPKQLADLIDDHHDDGSEVSSAHLVAGWDLTGGVDLRERVMLQARDRAQLDELVVDEAINRSLVEAQSIAELFY